MPKQGVTSTFRFGAACGQLVGLVIGMGLRLTLIRPQEWQRYHRIGGAPDAARQRALQLHPELSKALARKMDNHKADALLIVKYLYSQLSASAPTPQSAIELHYVS
jgi:crossover junction endodeoxyribonuclease RuvC